MNDQYKSKTSELQAAYQQKLEQESAKHRARYAKMKARLEAEIGALEERNRDLDGIAAEHKSYETFMEASDEDKMRALFESKQRIELECEKKLKARDRKVSDLRADARAAERERDDQQAEMDALRDDHRADIDALRDELDRAASDLRAARDRAAWLEEERARREEAHDAALARRDAEIDELHAQLSQMRRDADLSKHGHGHQHHPLRITSPARVAMSPTKSATSKGGDFRADANGAAAPNGSAAGDNHSYGRPHDHSVPHESYEHSNGHLSRDSSVNGRGGQVSGGQMQSYAEVNIVGDFHGDAADYLPRDDPRTPLSDGLDFSSHGDAFANGGGRGYPGHMNGGEHLRSEHSPRFALSSQNGLSTQHSPASAPPHLAMPLSSNSPRYSRLSDNAPQRLQENFSDGLGVGVGVGPASHGHTPTVTSPPGLSHADRRSPLPQLAPEYAGSPHSSHSIGDQQRFSQGSPRLPNGSPGDEAASHRRSPRALSPKPSAIADVAVSGDDDVACEPIERVESAPAWSSVSWTQRVTKPDEEFNEVQTRLPFPKSRLARLVDAAEAIQRNTQCHIFVPAAAEDVASTSSRHRRRPHSRSPRERRRRRNADAEDGDDGEEDEDVVCLELTGTDVAVESASQEIRKLEVFTTSLDVEAEYLPALLGEDSSNLRRIERTHRCEINVPSSCALLGRRAAGSDDGVRRRATVHISSKSEEDLESARREIEVFQRPDKPSARMAVQPDVARVLRGPSGTMRTLKRLREETGTKIFVDVSSSLRRDSRASSPRDRERGGGGSGQSTQTVTVEIAGSRRGVEFAQDEIHRFERPAQIYAHIKVCREAAREKLGDANRRILDSIRLKSPHTAIYAPLDDELPSAAAARTSSPPPSYKELVAGGGPPKRRKRSEDFTSSNEDFVVFEIGGGGSKEEMRAVEREIRGIFEPEMKTADDVRTHAALCVTVDARSVPTLRSLVKPRLEMEFDCRLCISSAAVASEDFSRKESRQRVLVGLSPLSTKEMGDERRRRILDAAREEIREFERPEKYDVACAILSEDAPFVRKQVHTIRMESRCHVFVPPLPEKSDARNTYQVVEITGTSPHTSREDLQRAVSMIQRERSDHVAESVLIDSEFYDALQASLTENEFHVDHTPVGCPPADMIFPRRHHHEDGADGKGSAGTGAGAKVVDNPRHFVVDLFERADGLPNDKARFSLKQYQRPSRHLSTPYSIMARDVKNVIGADGVNISRLREDTGCEFFLPPQSRAPTSSSSSSPTLLDDEVVQIDIIGTQAQAREAMKQLSNLVLPVNPDGMCMIGCNDVAKVVKYLDKIRRKSNCGVYLPRRYERGDQEASEEVFVFLTGTPEERAAAEREVRACVQASHDERCGTTPSAGGGTGGGGGGGGRTPRRRRGSGANDRGRRSGGGSRRGSQTADSTGTDHYGRFAATSPKMSDVYERLDALVNAPASSREGRERASRPSSPRATSRNGAEAKPPPVRRNNSTTGSERTSAGPQQNTSGTGGTGGGSTPLSTGGSSSDLRPAASVTFERRHFDRVTNEDFLAELRGTFRVKTAAPSNRTVEPLELELFGRRDDCDRARSEVRRVCAEIDESVAKGARRPAASSVASSSSKTFGQPDDPKLSRAYTEFVRRILIVPTRDVGFIIGQRGAMINSIQEATGTYVSVQERATRDNARGECFVRVLDRRSADAHRASWDKAETLIRSNVTTSQNKRVKRFLPIIGQQRLASLQANGSRLLKDFERDQKGRIRNASVDTDSALARVILSESLAKHNVVGMLRVEGDVEACNAVEEWLATIGAKTAKTTKSQSRPTSKSKRSKPSAKRSGGGQGGGGGRRGRRTESRRA